jgi:hypothetical protein
LHQKQRRYNPHFTNAAFRYKVRQQKKTRKKNLTSSNKQPSTKKTRQQTNLFILKQNPFSDNQKNSLKLSSTHGERIIKCEAPLKTKTLLKN